MRAVIRRVDWGAHAPSRAGDGALAIANFIPGKKRLFRRWRRNQHARARALPEFKYAQSASRHSLCLPHDCEVARLFRHRHARAPLSASARTPPSLAWSTRSCFGRCLIPSRNGSSSSGRNHTFPSGSVSYPNYLDWRAGQRSFTDLALVRRESYNFAVASGQRAGASERRARDLQLPRHPRPQAADRARYGRGGR